MASVSIIAGVLTDPWGGSIGDSCNTNAVFPEGNTLESPVFFDAMVTTGLSPTGCAFQYAWYGDSFRLFGLLDSMQKRGIKVSALRMGSEHQSFTQDVAAPDFSLLHVAVVCGHTNIVQDLVAKYGFSPNDRGLAGTIPSPLGLLFHRDPSRFGKVWSSRDDYVAMALLLLKLGARSETLYDLRWAVLHIQDEKLVEALLKNGSDPNALEKHEIWPLIQSVDPSSDKILQLLLKYGANLYATNYLGESIFDQANYEPKRRRQMERLHLLKSPVINSTNSVRVETSLVNGSVGLVSAKNEVEARADGSDYFPKVNFEDAATNGLSPKCAAFIYAWYGDSRRLYGLLDALVSKGVNVSEIRLASEYKVFTTDWDSPEFSLLHIAVVRGQTNIVQGLISKYGLSPDDKGKDGRTPTPLELLLQRNPEQFETQWVSVESFRSAVWQLIELGAHTQGSRELSHAILLRDASLVEAMLKSGSNPNHLYNDEAFPLILEVDPKDDGILKLMLDYGADVHATNFLGNSILDESRYNRKRKEQFQRLGLLPVDKR
jgi:ankyrin repeat protein